MHTHSSEKRKYKLMLTDFLLPYLPSDNLYHLPSSQVLKLLLSVYFRQCQAFSFNLASKIKDYFSNYYHG